jgi:hypothetical protein
MMNYHKHILKMKIKFKKTAFNMKVKESAQQEDQD